MREDALAYALEQSPVRPKKKIKNKNKKSSSASESLQAIALAPCDRPLQSLEGVVGKERYESNSAVRQRLHRLSQRLEVGKWTSLRQVGVCRQAAHAGF